METLTDVQRRVYAALQADGARCFLHLSRNADALWTTDLPARVQSEAAEAAQARLTALGFTINTAPDDTLWHIAPDENVLRSMFPQTQQPMPPVPDDEALWPLCQLARILIAHPAPLETQPRGDLYRILKHARSVNALSGQAPALLRSAAAALRSAQPLAYHGGLLIAYMLCNDESNGDD